MNNHAARLGRARILGPASLTVSLLLAGNVVAQEPVDRAAIHQIKQEGLRRSKVMEYAATLTDVHGPRLTGSPALRAAGQWAQKTFKDMGLANPRLEPWGPFGRGWSQERFDAQVISPQPFSLVGFAKAWTPSTAGRVSGEAVMISLSRDEDLKSWQGKLKGKFVLLTPPREVTPPFQAVAKRLTDAELADLAIEADPGRAGPRLPGMPAPEGQQAGGAPGGAAGGALPLYMSPPSADSPSRSSESQVSPNRAFVGRRMKFLIDEGVLAVLEPGRGDSGVFVVASGGPRDPKAAPVVPQVVLTIDHYGRIARLLARKLPVKIDMEVKNRFHDEDPMSFNVLADLPGTDKRQEVVMLGAHLDSWHGGTGATDNAAGVAVVMEALRILKASGLRLRRTVRVALWSGEEQGLYGSRAYVKANLADRATMKTLPGHGRFSGYFNLDNGTGAIRGVFGQSNDAILPVFESWVAPLRSLGVTTVSPRNTGGTDHTAFDEVGLPGFQFIQDPVDYSSRTHHTTLDTFERLIPGDMMKNAVVMAAFAYHAANRPERLPRKPMPRPPERAPAPAAPAPPTAPAPATSQPATSAPVAPPG